MGYKHILVIRYTLFCGISTKMEKKSERGVKGTKNKRLPPKERWRPQSPLPPPLPFGMELCEMSHVEKTLKNLEKQSEMKLRDVKV